VTFLDTPALPSLGAIRKKSAPKKKPVLKKKRMKSAPSKEKIAKVLAKPRKIVKPKITHHVMASPKKHTAVTPHTPSIPHHVATHHNPSQHKHQQIHKKPQHQTTKKVEHHIQHKTPHKKKHKERAHHEEAHTPILDPNKPLEQQLAENLVALQKVNIHLAEKFDKMEKQLSELLQLFEMAARSLAKQPENQTSQKDKEFLNKIDRLLDQNKTIAKGLTLMEDHVRSRIQDHKPQQAFSQQEPEARPPIGRPLPRF
jgi:hypothetical protein